MSAAPSRDQAIALFNQGRYAEAETIVLAQLDAAPDDPAVLRALSRLRLLLGRPEPPEGVEAKIMQAQTLASTLGAPALQGADEGARLQRAAELVLEVLPDIGAAQAPIAARILRRTACYEAEARLGDIAEMGRLCVEHGLPQMLLHQLARVETDEDRRVVLDLHRQWAAAPDRAAARNPLPPREGRPGGRVRLGFLSSDLRHHVVGFFAQPLFEFLDPRFELFVYASDTGAPDSARLWFMSRAHFRQLPRDDREAAALIADDDLDMLLDLGGFTAGGRPGVLPFKPARLQASWLGYPHSLGTQAIDFFVGDPWLLPADESLLVETPLRLPETWVCLAPAAFQPEPAPAAQPPSMATGRITFGTLNDPYKFGPRVLQAWGRVVAAAPGSRFLIARPEAGAPIFQDNVARHFAAVGVARERIEFRAIRGAVRQVYADIDIALDAFPVTGGVTTSDALWMGVPTVTLAGPAPYERMSCSLLSQVGLADLCAWTVDDYVAVAVGLAADQGRLADLRRTLRERVRASTLGQPDRFAATFYDAIHAAVEDARFRA